jgi:hypothetical protein
VPLSKGYSRGAIAKNIALESKTRPRKQALAIALSTARSAAEKAGKPSKGPKAPKKKKTRGERLRAMRGKLKGMSE